MAVAMTALPGSGIGAQANDRTQPVTVFAAASLKTAMDAAVATWRATTGNRVRIAYAASSALARQIEHGAPADVFFPANNRWMDYVETRGLIAAGSRRAMLGNSLVLVAPRRSELEFAFVAGSDLKSALAGGRLALANTLAVPAGLYAKQSLIALGMWKHIARHLAEAQNVRGALALVARGETPLGIVYATDAAAEPYVRIVAHIPASSHEPIAYPIALVHPIRNDGAAAFLAFLASEEGVQHFITQGFVRLR